ncbi:LAFA_0F07360g1_1 [Lachancea sp. 'fantastica']|nr:LAFA_0F07360g1_1 [Lachancea sp. 'fantastica']
MAETSSDKLETIQRENEDFSVFDTFTTPEKVAQLAILGSTVHVAFLKFAQSEQDLELFHSMLSTSVAILIGLGVSYRTRISNNGLYGSLPVRKAEVLPSFNVLYLLYLPTFLSLLFARELTILNLAMTFNCAEMAPYMRLPIQAIMVLINDQHHEKFEVLKALGLNCFLAFSLEKVGQLKSFDRVECNLFSIALTNVLFLIDSSEIYFQVLKNVLIGFLVAMGVNYPLMKLLSRCNTYLRSAVLLITFVCVFPLTVIHNFQINGENPAVWLNYYITSSSTRIKITLSWLVGLLLLIPNIMIFKSNFSLNSSRKIWHFIVLMLIVPPLKADPEFVKIALAGTMVSFLAVEYLRYLKLAPFGDYFDSKLRSFADFRDERGPIIISYIYLVIGVASPILINGSMVGVISLGLGDSLASIAGNRWGRHRWPGTNKTFEGTLAFVVATAFCSLSFKHFLGEFTDVSYLKLLSICLFSGLLEGNSVLNDNLLIPAFMLIVREIFK